MTEINIISGFLGAGKTTLIKKLLEEVFQGEKIVLIENEFGEIGIDGGFLKEAGIQVNEMNSGCICCSLVGDFGEALKQVLETYHPDRILIEPSGVGKLSDVAKAVETVSAHMDVRIDSAVTVVDAKKCRMYMKNFGEFFNNQIEHAGTIVLSRTQDVTDQKLEECVAMLKEHNAQATLITTPWTQLKGAQILSAMQHAQLDMHRDPVHEHGEHSHDCCGHEHDGHEHGEHSHDCCGHEHGEHSHDCCGHAHEHHEHGEHSHDCCGHTHEHHEHDGHEHGEHGSCEHDHAHAASDHHHHEHGHEHGEHGPGCTCGCQDHDHHGHHHHADEVFTSWGAETVHKYSREEMAEILKKLDEGGYGNVLRAKGIVAAVDGSWMEFDHVPEESEIRAGSPDYTGRLCVIGADLNEEALRELFHI
ncbi:MAG: cobalamin biosynthesis protein CobW [Lachnospiraceae bacterium]|nr:cobalamin biosynthesis protein CobW [Lachnospiraceae bacterium]